MGLPQIVLPKLANLTKGPVDALTEIRTSFGNTLGSVESSLKTALPALPAMSGGAGGFTLPKLPPMPTGAGLGGGVTPTPANPLQRALPTVPSINKVTILQPSGLQSGRGSL